MPARKNPAHSARAREKIKTSQLINRLQDDALGKIQITDGQRNSIRILLGKSMPDLKSIEHTGEVDGTIELTWAK